MKAVGNINVVNYIVATSFSLTTCKNIAKCAMTHIEFTYSGNITFDKCNIYIIMLRQLFCKIIKRANKLFIL